jgi:H/ACA ribonucleoprotein complex non-core subunit NAF1
VYIFRRGEWRPNSFTSRFTTPILSQAHEQDLENDFFPTETDNGPYDMDIGGLHRPMPMPYEDDPYSDAFNADASLPEAGSPHDIQGDGYSYTGNSIRGRWRDRGRGRSLRGRGDNGSIGDRGRRRGRGRGFRPSKIDSGNSWPNGRMDQNDSLLHRPLSPTSLAIARATGQFQNGAGFTVENQSMSPEAVGGWYPQHHQQQSDYNYNFIPQVYPQQYVQPHINPRFASAFGMRVDFMQPYPQIAINSAPTSISGGTNWTDEWTVSTSRQDTSPQG